MSAPTCRFDPQQMGVWSSQTGLCFVSDPQDGYRLAQPFLREQMRKLLGQGWKQGDKASDIDVLFHIYKPNKPGDSDARLREIILPKSFNSFLDPTKADDWRSVFEHTKVFSARKKNKKNADNCHPDLSPAPQPQLCNIFYLLQILAPGMLVIKFEYTVRNTEIKVLRALPPASWIERTCPQIGLTLAGGIDTLILAANNPHTLLDQRVVQPNNNTSAVPKPSARLGRNLPFPVSLVDPANLKSLQTPNRASEDGKDVKFKQTTPQTSQTSDIRSDGGSDGFSGNIAASQSSSYEPHIPAADSPKAETSTSGKKKKKKAKKEKKEKAPSSSPASNANRKGNASRKEPRYRVVEGYLLPETYGGGYDWSVCDKDCGWCGRCELQEY